MATEDEKKVAGHSMNEHAKGLSWAHEHAEDADHDHDAADHFGREHNPQARHQ